MKLNSPITRRNFLHMAGVGSTAALISPFLSACTDQAALKAGSDRLTGLADDPADANSLWRLTDYAVLAPNGHNSQPWIFSIQDDVVRVSPDFSRELPVVDPDHRELFISIGCAVENLLIAGRHFGYSGEILPVEEQAGAGIQVRFTPAAEQAETLFEAITRRQSTRSAYDGSPLQAADRQFLLDLALPEGTACWLIETPDGLEKAAGLVGEGDNQQYASQEFVDELLAWLRFNQTEALKTLDGLYTACSGNPTLPRWLGQMFVTTQSGPQMAEKDAGLVRGSSAVLVITTRDENRDAWIAAGMACERLLLTLTQRNIQSAFVNQPLEIPALRAGFMKEMGLDPDLVPQALLRLGFGKLLPFSLRRPVEQV
jgi:hypothetical protein